jgi:hypothetical protein
MTITRHLPMFLLSIETQIPAPCSERFLFSYVSLLARKERRRLTAYIALNHASIPNYGDRRRHGECIASSFVESAVNQVVSKRMVKKQQMRWGERGAHLLLQVRTQVLNGDLRQWFSRWYPGMEDEAEPVLLDEAA